MDETVTQSLKSDFTTLFSQKAPTGISGLDHILDGGINRTNSFLIEGAPGSGKSTLGVQILVRGAELYGEPGVMVAFEEFPRQLYAEYSAFGFDLEGLEKKGLLRIIWTDPRKVVKGFTGKDDLISRIVDEMKAKRLLIDSITHFRRVANEDIDLRELLYNVLNNLKLKGVNSFLVKELEKGETDSIAFEEYVVDASLRILNEPVGKTGKNRRSIQIRKTRGQKHISGEHPFEFRSDGIHVYPHLQPEDVTRAVTQVQMKGDRVPTGISGFDRLIEGGFRRGSLNVVVGYSGTGKTALARHFAHSRLKRGERTLFVSFQEAEGEIESYSRNFGLDLEDFKGEGLLDVWSVSPVGLLPEKFLDDLLTRIREGNYSALAWDSLSDLRTSIQDPDALRETHHLIGLMLRRAGITALLLNESTEMCGLIRLTELDFVELADSVTQLSFAEVDGRVHRFLGVMKMAATNHSKDLHEFEITGSGMVVRKKATGISGILSGHAGGKLEAVAEQVLDPLMESSQALAQLLHSDTLSEADRKSLIAARGKLGLADIVLREHFGMTDLSSLVEEFDLDSL